jgi:hypothetical protein
MDHLGWAAGSASVAAGRGASNKKRENNPMHSSHPAGTIDVFLLREKQNNRLLRRAKQGQNGMMAVVPGRAKLRRHAPA